MVMQNICFIRTNKQVNNRHVNKQQVNSKNWSLC